MFWDLIQKLNLEKFMTIKSTPTLSHLTASLRQSGIRSASVRCAALQGINLGQGVCDIPTHDNIKAAAAKAINENKNLYAAYEGVFDLRSALAQKIQNFNKVSVDPNKNILISHGSTGSYVSAVKTLFNPGDQVILFEPFYGYHKHVLELLGVHATAVNAEDENFAIDFDQLRVAITPKTRGIVICSPCNPSGKVFTREELITIGNIANEHNLFIITDEIYEYITYPGHEHISIASLNDFAQRTVTISGFSKTYNVTGWRLGYSYGPEEIMNKMALVHDLLYICPPTPLQHAMIAALNLDDQYIQEMQDSFLNKRNLMVSALRNFGFRMREPQGAYYLMANFKDLGFENDEVAANLLLEQAKVATVTGRSFYQKPESGCYELRFCFALSEDKIQAAMDNIRIFLGK